MLERRQVTDALLVIAGMGLILLTCREYRYVGSLTGPIQPSAPSPLAAEARIQATKAYLQSHQDDFRAWADLGIAYYQKGPEGYVDGLNALDKARKLGAAGEALFWYAGVMFQGVGLPEYATSELEKYLRHYPDHKDTRVRLANLYLQQKRLEESWQLYQELRRENPDDPVILANYELVSKEIAKKTGEKNGQKP